MGTNREAEEACYAQIQDALLGLVGLDTSDYDEGQRLGRLAAAEGFIRTLQGLGHTVLNQMREAEEALRAQGKRGRLKLRDDLANALLIAPREATERIEASKSLGVTTVGGELRAPRLPEAARAQLEGRVGGGHLRILIGFDSRLTENVAPEARERANMELADYACVSRPDALRVFENEKAHEIDPLDSREKQKRRAQRRSLTISAPDEDGVRRLTGRLTPELGVLFDALLDPNARLQGEGDDRTVEQRLHDALETVLKNVGTGKTKTVVHLYAHVSLEELAKAGTATTPTGARVPIWGLLKQASAVIPYLVLFKDKARKIPLDLYRSRRLATSHIRHTLGITGGGCSHPGCGVTAQHCEIHHLQEWRKGGNTNIENLTLVCDYHHHMIDEGWTVQRVNDEIHWTPPEETRPRINTHFRKAA